LAFSDSINSAILLMDLSVYRARFLIGDPDLICSLDRHIISSASTESSESLLPPRKEEVHHPPLPVNIINVEGIMMSF